MKDFQRPKTQRGLEEREAAGFWQAIGLVNKLAKEKNRAINVITLRRIHRTIFKNAFPEIAGRFRVSGEDVKKLHYITPLPGSAIASRMESFEQELIVHLGSIPPKPKTRRRETLNKWLIKVVEVAAWAQHAVVAIHPFANGNGRTGRLFTNLILQSHGLTGSRIKFEQADKDAYLDALAQIDKVHDYEPLQRMILRAMSDQYRFIIRQKMAYLKGK